MAENGGVDIRLLFFRAKIASQLRANSEHLEKLLRNGFGRELLCIANAGQSEAILAVSCNCGEGTLLRTPIEEIRIADVARYCRPRGSVFNLQPDQTILLRKWKRA